MWLHSSVGRAPHRYRGGHGFEFRWSPDFFRLLLSNCLNWKINCDYHSSLSSTTAVHIWIISYKLHITANHCCGFCCLFVCLFVCFVVFLHRCRLHFNFLKLHLFLRSPIPVLSFPSWVFHQTWLEESCTALYRICFLVKGRYICCCLEEWVI